MTGPPEWLMQWVLFLGAAFALLAFVWPRLRRWVFRPMIQPLVDKLDEHEERHQRADRAAEIVERELTQNGGDEMLPPGERGDTVRNIAIRARMDIKEHKEWSEETMRAMNEERVGQGLPPLPTESSDK